MIQPKNTSELVTIVHQNNLYQNLINQLNKDLGMVNLSEKFNSDISPDELKEGLLKLLQNLIEKNYEQYLNLIYRIDVSERDLRLLTTNNLSEDLENLTFLILKREFQKVWTQKYFGK